MKIGSIIKHTKMRDASFKVLDITEVRSTLYISGVWIIRGRETSIKQTLRVEWSQLMDWTVNEAVSFRKAG